MLLVAQEYCSAEDFKKLICDLRAAKIRISEDLIDLDKLNGLALGYISADRQGSYNETAEIIAGIKQIIAGNLKGNPRQAKRFLNTFTTKRKLAELYYDPGEIDYRVLAKLLVLHKLNPALFIELNEWNKRFTTENEEYRQMRDAVTKEDNAPATDDRYKAWRVPAIVKWVESDPVDLEKRRLDRYFYLTRESLRKAEIDISSISAAAKDILAKIGNSTAGSIHVIIEAMKELTTLDKDDIIEVLLPQLSQAKLELYVAAELFETFDEYREKILDALRNYAGKITMKSVPQLMRIRAADQEKTDELLDLWKKNGKLTDAAIVKIKGEGA